MRCESGTRGGSRANRPFKDKVGKYSGPTVKNPAAMFAGMMTKLDEGVGQILEILKELELDQDTLVMLSSDNGPHREGGQKL